MKRKHAKTIRTRRAHRNRTPTNETVNNNSTLNEKRTRREIKHSTDKKAGRPPQRPNTERPIFSRLTAYISRHYYSNCYTF